MRGLATRRISYDCDAGSDLVMSLIHPLNCFPFGLGQERLIVVRSDRCEIAEKL
jgi:hypothetical protein